MLLDMDRVSMIWTHMRSCGLRNGGLFVCGVVLVLVIIFIACQQPQDTSWPVVILTLCLSMNVIELGDLACDVMLHCLVTIFSTYCTTNLFTPVHSHALLLFYIIHTVI